jgi:hypothetical protein
MFIRKQNLGRERAEKEVDLRGNFSLRAGSGADFSS